MPTHSLNTQFLRYRHSTGLGPLQGFFRGTAPIFFFLGGGVKVVMLVRMWGGGVLWVMSYQAVARKATIVLPTPSVENRRCSKKTTIQPSFPPQDADVAAFDGSRGSLLLWISPVCASVGRLSICPSISDYVP